MKFLKILLLLSTPLISVNYLVAQTTEIQATENQEKKTAAEQPSNATTPPTATTRANSTVAAQELPFYKENDHFAFYCQPVDQFACDIMLEKFEPFLKQISAEFNHNCTSKFIFKIYPNIKEFHNAIGLPDAPDYICGYMAKDESVAYSVSPNNPGSVHSFNFIVKANLNKIVGLVIKDKYKNNPIAPSWLYLGICSYKSSMVNEIADKFLAKNIQKLPTLQQLKETYENYSEFTKIEGWRASYSIAKFIDKKHGLEKLFALLENDNSTQLVLGLSEDELRTQWINYLVSEYGQKDLLETNKTTPTQELPLYKENDHFAFFCQPVDQSACNIISEKCETFLKQLTTDFNHNYTQKVTFKIYPNISDFHNAVGLPNASEWFCSLTDEKNNTSLSVSPNNPGSNHTANLIITSHLCNLTGLVIQDKYRDKFTFPAWLYLGICLYKSGVYDNDSPVYECSKDKALAQNIENLPTLQQLEKAYSDMAEFKKIEGWHVSNSIAKFIDKKYGWDKFITLLDDYSAMQSILGVTEDELRAQWIDYLVSEYGQKDFSAKN